MFRDRLCRYRSGQETIPMENLSFYGGYYHSICYKTFIKHYFAANPILERFSVRGTHPMQSLDQVFSDKTPITRL